MVAGLIPRAGESQRRKIASQPADGLAADLRSREPSYRICGGLVLSRAGGVGGVDKNAGLELAEGCECIIQYHASILRNGGHARQLAGKHESFFNALEERPVGHLHHGILIQCGSHFNGFPAMAVSAQSLGSPADGTCNRWEWRPVLAILRSQDVGERLRKAVVSIKKRSFELRACID